MKATRTFLLANVIMIIINVIGALLFDIEPMNIESVLILLFALTWCSFKDKQTSNHKKGNI